MAWKIGQMVSGDIAGVKVDIELDTYQKVIGVTFDRPDCLTVHLGVWGSHDSYLNGDKPANVANLEFGPVEQPGEPPVVDPADGAIIVPAGAVRPSAADILENEKLHSALDTVKSVAYELSRVYIRNLSRARKV